MHSNGPVIIVYLQIVPVGAAGKGPVLRRQKRNWISAPRHLQENQDYTGYQYIARVGPLQPIATSLSAIFLKEQHGCDRKECHFHLQDSVSCLDFDDVT